MREFASFRSRGQTLILVALAAVALIAFVALAVDGSNAYSARREAQSAADGAAIAGTWVMVEYTGGSPVADILRKVNTYAESNGVADTNGIPGDPINNNVLAYYVDADGNRLIDDQGQDWELHTGPLILPSNARGIEAVTTISRTTFFARVIGVNTIQARATATARYEIDGGILPIAVNEYWAGSQGHCPYDNCEEPYSFVRNPGEQPPFKTTDGGLTWQRNICPDPYNDNTCQGPYEGYGENFGKAFALLGADAKPNYGSQDPRSFVHLDYRYDAMVDGGYWHWLMSSDQWQHNVKPVGKKGEMAEVIASGGYTKQPIPRALHEPPPEYYIDGWSECWALPHNEDNCFNYPEDGRSIPYDVVQFLSGADAAAEAKEMYDDGNYVDGRFAPGERIVIMVYNGFSAQQWGNGGNKDDAAVIVGYFGAIIVGYGNNFDTQCEQHYHPTPGDWASYVPCIDGQPNTVFGIAAPSAPLTIDPSKLLEEFLPKKITLIK